jgi:hypothetical protein
VNAPQLLEAAIKEIETKGWCQGGMGGQGQVGTPCCAGVALHRAWDNAEDAPVYDRARTALVNVLPVEYRNFNAIVRWNDEPGRTKKEVLKKMREALAALRPGSKKRRRR